MGRTPRGKGSGLEGFRDQVTPILKRAWVEFEVLDDLDHLFSRLEVLLEEVRWGYEEELEQVRQARKRGIKEEELIDLLTKLDAARHHLTFRGWLRAVRRRVPDARKEEWVRLVNRLAEEISRGYRFSVRAARGQMDPGQN